MLDQWMALGLGVQIAFVALLGLIVGSFLNVVVVRLPPLLAHRWAVAHEMVEGAPTSPPPNLIWPRSQCPQCKKTIAWYDNIPLISWLLLKGRCRHCQAPISKRYPIIEGLSALAAGVVLWQLGPSTSTLGALVLTWYLIALAAIDLEHQLLPDGLTLSLLWLGLMFSASVGGFATPTEAIFGAVAGYGLLWLVFHAFFYLTGKEGLGYGDFKLLAALGAWLGWSSLPLVLFIGSVLGTLAGIFMIVVHKKGKDTPLAFGPYLAIGGWVALLWGQSIMDGLFPALF